MDEAIDEVEKISRDERIIGLYDKEKVERKLLNSFKEEMWAGGKAEAKKEIIVSMKTNGFDNETIAKILNISLEDLEKLVSES